MILVAGSTGSLGTDICKRLVERGHQVRALVRATSSPEKVEALRAAGVQLALGDLTHAESLRAACAGVEVVISTATSLSSQQPNNTFSSVDDAGMSALIDAAKAENVDHFVMISVSGGLQVGCPLLDSKRSTEARLVQSGLAYTILRPAAFMDTWFGPAVGWDHTKHTATVLGSGEQKISFIAEADVARFAVASVALTSARNRIVELGGPEAITPNDAVALFERLTGARYTVQHVPVAALRAQYDAAADAMQKTFAGLMLGLASDDVIPMATTAREFGVMPTPLGEIAIQLAPMTAPQ